MSADPRRMAALVQGYPVRSPFSPLSGGDLRLWWDFSDEANTTVSSGNYATITDKSGNRGQRTIQTSNGVVASRDTRNGLYVAALTSDGVAERAVVTATTSETHFNFLHTSAAHVFAVIKSPPHPESGMRRLRIGTCSNEAQRGFFVEAWDNGTETSASVLTAIGRNSSTSSVAKIDQRAIWPSDTWGLVHVATDPTNATYANRMTLAVRGTTYANNTQNASVSSADSDFTLGIRANNTCGAVAELLIYSGSLSVSSSVVSAYLTAKWGL